MSVRSHATRLSTQMQHSLMAGILLIVFLFVGLIFNTPVTSFLLAVLIASLLGTRRTGFLTLAVAIVLFLLFFRYTNPWLSPSHSPYWKLTFLVCVGLLLPGIAETILRMERSKIKSDTDFKTLLETCPDSILLLDHDQQIVGANAAALSLFAFNESALLGSNVGRILPAIQFDRQSPTDYAGLTRTGDPLCVSANWSQLADRTILFLRDVTAQRKTQAELRASEENLRLLVDNIPALIYVRDGNGRLQQVSRRVSEYNGLSLDDLRRDNGFTAVHPEEQAPLRSLLAYRIPNAKPFSYEFRHRRFDGTYRRFHASMQPLHNDLGAPIRWYTLLTDVEDQRAMEGALRDLQNELAEASRMATVTEITASVVHEISQPLSAAISTAQAGLRLLQADPIDHAAIRTAMERILHNNRDATQIVRNMRSLFRRRAGGNDAVDLTAVLDDVLLLAASQIQSVAVRVHIDTPPTRPFVAADRLQLQQVVLNLVSNAIESMEANGEVTRDLYLNVSDQDGSILTEVADTGHGLSDPRSIFDAFFTTKPTGMGMGLKICKSIIDAHQGRLWTEPRQPRGTRFLFTLPRAATPQPAAAPQPAKESV